MIKRSFTLHGHRTSVSLEAEFWELLDCYAKVKGQASAAIVAKVDEGRLQAPMPPLSLSSALRIFLLREVLAGNLNEPSAFPAALTPTE